MITRLLTLLVGLCLGLGVLLPGPAVAAGFASGAPAPPVRTQLPQEVPALGEAGSAPMLGEPVPGTASQLDEPGSAALLDGVDSGTVAVLSEPSQSAARGTARSVETQQNLLRSPGRPVVPLVVLGSALVLLGVLLASARARHPLVSLPAPGAAAGVGLRPS